MILSVTNVRHVNDPARVSRQLLTGPVTLSVGVDAMDAISHQDAAQNKYWKSVSSKFSSNFGNKSGHRSYTLTRPPTKFSRFLTP